MSVNGLRSVVARTAPVTNSGSTRYSRANTVVRTAVGIADSRIAACRPAPVRPSPSASNQANAGETRRRIPAAAGLGGGSSDAAAVLAGLNAMLCAGLTRSELMALGVRLGADVPFFLFGRTTAWATGIGERLTDWRGLPPFWLVLVNPGIAVSTAEVFQNLGLTRRRPVARIPRFPKGTSDLVRLLHNDLEVVTCQRHPLISTIKDSLLTCGASGALMSGSGPTVFGVFDDRLTAERAAETVKRPDWWVEVVRPL